MTRWKAAVLLALLFCGEAALPASAVRIPAGRQPAGLASGAAVAAHPAARRLAAVTSPGRSRPAATGGKIPLDVRNKYNPAKNPTGPGVAAGRPTPALAPAVANFSSTHYKQALRYALWFYDAQRSGALPRPYRVAWRNSSHPSDAVVGGYYDAGDFIKHSLTTAQASTFLAWAALDFMTGFNASGQLPYAQATVRNMASYLAACHISTDQYVGLIGDPDVDHNYWGRPEQQEAWLRSRNSLPRKTYIWTRAMAASDLMGMSSAAMASASMLLKATNPAFSAALLTKAQTLYAWGKSKLGLYSDSYPGYNKDVYGSSSYRDKLFLAAAWLYRATGQDVYQQEAYGWFSQLGGRWGASVYVSWDDVTAPAVMTLLTAARQRNTTAKVKGFSEYQAFMADTFVKTWARADGSWSIRATPGGMRYMTWSGGWGNLRYANNAALVALAWAAQQPAGTARTEAIDFGRLQVDYALGRMGRSYVSGFGTNPPLRAHHAAASCPNMPAACDWPNFDSPNPNPQVLYGALVGGPGNTSDYSANSRTTDAMYKDSRQDYYGNEVSLDYNAGFTGALGALLALLAPTPPPPVRRVAQPATQPLQGR
ncbi:hypothetical protein COHA_004576 [Chlorella ohadii]|uniref:Endoglucanase n=1 Tax=Chlorella ohadii TaxID=2649997 RepID=A0AAD5DWQ1_9CHLO|nr:hypothetical protein COHA_004576 [Chlorella ohadii]